MATSLPVNGKALVVGNALPTGAYYYIITTIFYLTASAS